MGFIIKSDDTSSFCSAFVGAKQNERLTFLRLRLIDLARPTASSKWGRLTSAAFEPADIHRLCHSAKSEPTGKHLIKCVSICVCICVCAVLYITPDKLEVWLGLLLLHGKLWNAYCLFEFNVLLPECSNDCKSSSEVVLQLFRVVLT